MKINKQLIGLMALGATVLSACIKEDEQKVKHFSNTYAAYVINEGNFGIGNGDITRIDIEDMSVDTNIFMSANGVPAGDSPQSITFHDNQAYIVVGGSNRIEVVSTNDFSSSTTIDNLEMPRYMVTKGTFGYVSEWLGYDADWSAKDTGRISIIDLNTNSITGSFDVSEGPDQMLVHGNNIWIANTDTNLVSVFNTQTNEITTIAVGYSPNSFVVDSDNTVWVLCSGKPSWATGGPTPGSLHAFSNGETNPVSPVVLPFNNTDANPSQLNINKAGDQLIYLFNGVCIVGTNDGFASTNPVLLGSFYGLSVDSENDVIYAFDAKGFTSLGEAKMIYPDNSVDSIAGIGIGPNGAVFH